VAGTCIYVHDTLFFGTSGHRSTTPRQGEVTRTPDGRVGSFFE
jgi:hypothetical protein